MSNDGLSRSEIDNKLRTLDNKLDILRRNYEQFFVGSRERPPRNERRQVDRLVRDLEQASISNTSQRFKLRGLIQRYTSYKQKWNRVERQIEQGTYAPHKRRARERQKAKERTDKAKAADGEQQDDAVELEADVGDVDLESLQKELEEMDEEGEFEKYVETERMGRADFEEAERKQGQQRRQQEESKPRRRPPSEESPSRSDRRDGGQSSGGSDDPTRRKPNKKKLREIQDKLGLSSGSDKIDDRREKLDSARQDVESGGSQKERPRRRRPDQGDGSGGSERRRRSQNFEGGANEPTEKLSPVSPDNPSRGAKREDIEKLRKARDKVERRRQSKKRPRKQQQRKGREGNRDSKPRRKSGSDSNERVIERSNRRRRRSSRRGTSEDSADSASEDDEESHAERLFHTLIETKRRYSEEFEHLTFDAVRNSMEHQRRVLHERHDDISEIQFRVVVKNEKVFLQPRLRRS